MGMYASETSRKTLKMNANIYISIDMYNIEVALLTLRMIVYV